MIRTFTATPTLVCEDVLACVTQSATATEPAPPVESPEAVINLPDTGTGDGGYRGGNSDLFILGAVFLLVFGGATLIYFRRQ